jgi:hypothetical protein
MNENVTIEVTEAKDIILPLSPKSNQSRYSMQKMGNGKNLNAFTTNAGIDFIKQNSI